MANVARIFNDAGGVELTERTGSNPAYTYLSLGAPRQPSSACSTLRARRWASRLATWAWHALLFPRASDGKTYYCAELVAAILKQGGLMSQDSNPGAATPYSLYKLYNKQAAATANPFTLGQTGQGFEDHKRGRSASAVGAQQRSVQRLHSATHAGTQDTWDDP